MIYFEGGEPFLYYPILLKGVRSSHELGFRNGIVTNGYWATTVDDALEWLRPLAGLVKDLSVSSDLYHYDEKLSQKAKNAGAAAGQLGIPVNVLSIAPVKPIKNQPAGDTMSGEGKVMFRGRAAVNLAPKTKKHAWTQFTECPYEDLKRPGRVHVDPYGNVHICQGLSIGNLFLTSLKEIVRDYKPNLHPVIGPLTKGGPAELVKRYGVSHHRSYADACHLCYESRKELRKRFPQHLLPDQMYGEG